MTFPISNPVTQTWYNSLVNDVTNIQGYCTSINTGTTGGAAVQGNLVVNLAIACVQLNADITFVGNNSLLTTAVEAYFNAQPGWSAINVGTEFSTLGSLATAILTALATDYPTSSGYLLDRTWSNTAGVVWRTFTAAQIPHVMTAITNFLGELATS